MDDLQLIQYLGRSLVQAAQSQDWLRVQSVDRQIAHLLEALSEHPLSQDKRHALLQLKACHSQVNQVCQQQSTLLQQKMVCQRRNFEGAVAYAAFAMDKDT